jgi:hypothetical protein
MYTVMLMVVAIGTTECACRLPFKTMLARFLEVPSRAMRAIRNDAASDHWKQKALLKLAKLSLISSARVGGAILGLVGLFVVSVYLMSLLSPALWPFAMSVKGIAIASVFAVLYLIGRVYAESRLQRG